MNVCTSAVANTNIGPDLGAACKYLGTWDSYIRDMLNSGHIEDGAIYDLSGKLLAASDGFKLYPEEFVTLSSRVSIPDCNYGEEISVAGCRHRKISFGYWIG